MADTSILILNLTIFACLCFVAFSLVLLLQLGEMSTPSRCGRMDQCVVMGVGSDNIPSLLFFLLSSILFLPLFFSLSLLIIPVLSSLPFFHPFILDSFLPAFLPVLFQLICIPLYTLAYHASSSYICEFLLPLT